MHLDIRRFECWTSGTLSRVRVFNDPTCLPPPLATFYGVEQPWRNNEANASCIPDGDYQLVPHRSEKFGQVWAFVGATVSHMPEVGKARSACLIHVGNFSTDVHGCLALGLGIGPVTSGVGKMVVSSKKAIGQLRQIMPPDRTHTARIGWDTTP